MCVEAKAKSPALDGRGTGNETVYSDSNEPDAVC